MDDRFGRGGPAADGAASSLGVERTLAFSMAVITLVPGVLVVAEADHRVAAIARSAVPALLLVAAVVMPRPLALGALAGVLSLLAYAAVSLPHDRAVLIASAVADVLIVAAQLTANHVLSRRSPAACAADHGRASRREPPALPSTTPCLHIVALAPPVARPLEWARLSPRQGAVLDLVIEGLSAESIAHRLSISRRTVESHASAGYSKLGVASRRDLILICRELDDPGRAHPHSPVRTAYGGVPSTIQYRHG